MRPIVYYSAGNLHGYIARPEGAADWAFAEPDDQKQEPPRVDFLNSLLGG
jgi:hypothetical protein